MSERIEHAHCTTKEENKKNAYEIVIYDQFI